MQSALARTLALSGRTEPARDTLQKLDDISRTRYVSPFEFVALHFALGDIEDGYRWLVKACDDRCFEFLALKVDPRFDPLRDDHRFTEVSRRVVSA